MSSLRKRGSSLLVILSLPKDLLHLTCPAIGGALIQRFHLALTCLAKAFSVGGSRISYFVLRIAYCVLRIAYFVSRITFHMYNKLMSTKRHLLINTGSQMIGKVVTSGTTFIISILIARSLGADGYGDFSKITTYIPIFYLFADFGLNAAYIQKEQEDKKSYLPTLFSIRILGSITLMLSLIHI